MANISSYIVAAQNSRRCLCGPKRGSAGPNLTITCATDGAFLCMSVSQNFPGLFNSTTYVEPCSCFSALASLSLCLALSALRVCTNVCMPLRLRVSGVPVGATGASITQTNVCSPRVAHTLPFSRPSATDMLGSSADVQLWTKQARMCKRIHFDCCYYHLVAVERAFVYWGISLMHPQYLQMHIFH